MPITRTVYDTEDLLGVYQDLEPAQNFWLSMYPGTFNSEHDKIEWNKITDHRFLAPLVLPTVQGRPIGRADEDIQAVKPAYLKPKNAITAAAMGVRQVGLGELGRTTPLSPKERYDAQVVAMMQRHMTSIQRFWEWMAAQATLFGQVTLEDDGYPRATVNFRRDAGQTVILGAGSYWGDAGVSIVDDIEAWNDTMADADFGAPAAQLILGTEAWKVFKADPEIQKLLDKDIRNTSGTSLDIGIGDGSKLQYKGNISRNIEVWVYSDYYHAADGSVVPFMDPRDILLKAAAIDGIKCFGAIYDEEADWQPLAMFPKMWSEKDPSATVLMTQSAPIMVPVNPNKTFRARVRP